MSIDSKTPGELIDILITTNIKCFMAQETIMDSEASDKEVAKAARQAQELNARRCNTVRAIDQKLGAGADTLTEKTYDKGK